MPHRDTSLAIQHAIYRSKWWGQSNALNATQGLKPIGIQQAIYRSQMMVTIQYSKCHTHHMIKTIKLHIYHTVKV